MKQPELTEQIRNFINNEDGDAFFGVIVQTLAIVTLVLTLVNTYNLFWKQQNVIYLTRNLVRAIELDGNTDNADSLFSSLSSSMGLDAGTTYSVSCAGKIQLRDAFTVTVNSPYTLDVFGAQGKGISLNLNLQSTLEGISEVYWKELAVP